MSVRRHCKAVLTETMRFIASTSRYKARQLCRCGCHLSWLLPAHLCLSAAAGLCALAPLSFAGNPFQQLPGRQKCTQEHTSNLQAVEPELWE